MLTRPGTLNVAIAFQDDHAISHLRSIYYLQNGEIRLAIKMQERRAFAHRAAALRLAKLLTA